LALEDGFFQAGVAHRRISSSVNGLLRDAFSGRVGNVLVLRSVVHRLRTNRPGERAARLTLLRAALSRVRAQGVRVVWLAWADARVAGWDAELRRVAELCDSVIVDDPQRCRSWRASCCIPCAVPCLREHVGVSCRDLARETLGLPPQAPVLLYLGPVRNRGRLARRLRQFEDRSPRRARLLVDQRIGPLPQFDGGIIDRVDVRHTPRSLTRAIAASDAVIVDDGPHAPELVAHVRARHREVLGPADLDERGWLRLLEDLETRHVRWREYEPRPVASARELVESILGRRCSSSACVVG
jgi:hypothetical protein